MNLFESRTVTLGKNRGIYCTKGVNLCSLMNISGAQKSGKPFKMAVFEKWHNISNPSRREEDDNFQENYHSHWHPCRDGDCTDVMDMGSW